MKKARKGPGDEVGKKSKNDMETNRIKRDSCGSGLASWNAVTKLKCKPRKFGLSTELIM